MNDKTVVVIEQFIKEYPNRVCVYEFDRETNSVLIDIEVCSTDEAYAKYNVVGQIADGLINLFVNDEEEEELDMFDEDFEEMDDE